MWSIMITCEALSFTEKNTRQKTTRAKSCPFIFKGLQLTVHGYPQHPLNAALMFLHAEWLKTSS